MVERRQARASHPRVAFSERPGELAERIALGAIALWALHVMLVCIALWLPGSGGR